jgi:hypothetical protein
MLGLIERRERGIEDGAYEIVTLPYRCGRLHETSIPVYSNILAYPTARKLEDLICSGNSSDVT